MRFKKTGILKKIIILISFIFLASFYSCSPDASLNDQSKSTTMTETAYVSSTVSESALSDEDLAKQKEELDKKLMAEAETDAGEKTGEATDSNQELSSELSLSADDINPDGTCDLIIVTPIEFAGALIPLKEHKNNTGISAKIISLEDIYANYSGKDEAEKVKYCLADYNLKSSTRFAMLVGDADRFPIRYTKADIDNPDMNNWGFFATDFYYSSLFKADGSFDDWDGNKNGYFGELQGTVYTGKLNMDGVDLFPDICVGRVPASTIEEVSNYVKKDIEYESNASAGSWIDNALLVGTTNYMQNAPTYMEELSNKFLKDKQVFKLYGELPDEIIEKLKADSAYIEAEKTEPINAENVLKYLNSGVGLVLHVGHGSTDGWYEVISSQDFTRLNNFKALPIIFSGGCSTGDFECHPPGDSYLDIYGNMHAGETAGEVFPDIPAQPACLQLESNHEGMGEIFTVYGLSGSIGYIGCDIASQNIAEMLYSLFFESLIMDKATLGEMWDYSVKEYYKKIDLPEELTQPNWRTVSHFHQPWKYFLFGDPSLRINGV